MLLSDFYEKAPGEGDFMIRDGSSTLWFSRFPALLLLAPFLFLCLQPKSEMFIRVNGIFFLASVIWNPSLFIYISMNSNDGNIEAQQKKWNKVQQPGLFSVHKNENR